MAEVAGINSRLRYMPEAGKEVMLVLNHGSTINADSTLTSINSDITFKVSYTFRY